MNKYSYLFLIFPVLLLLTCNTTDPNPNGKLTFTLEDVSCTEAWLKISSDTKGRYILTRDDKEVIQINLITSDTIVVDDSLSPNKTYNYKISSMEHPSSGIRISVSTMDTTSHNLTWQTWTFGGESGSSTFYDVAMINENNIWVVGEIHTNDSLGHPDPQVYNIAHWNGVEWEQRKIPFDYIGSLFYGPIYSVYSFNENDIWLGIANIIRYNGKNLNSVIIPSSIFPVLINKMWGDDDNIYLAGRKGKIARYNRHASTGGWQKVESGTDIDINDIWGINENEKTKLFCAVSNVFEVSEHKILTIDENMNIDSVGWNTERRVHSIWTKKGFPLYVSGGGIFENKKGYWNEVTEVPLYYSRSVRGNDLNDIFVCGDFGLFAHYNGHTWKTYQNLFLQGIYYSLAVKENMVVAVGFSGEQAIIVMGKR